MGNHRIQIVTAEHRTQVIEFLQNDFRISEPTFRSFGMSREVALPIWNDTFDECTKENTSLVCFDQNNTIIGVSLNVICDSDTSIEPLSGYTGDAAKLVDYLYAMEKDLHSLEPDVKRWFKLDLLAVAKNHRREGIATELCDRTVQIARDYGCDGLTAESMSLASQRAFKKMGYSVAFELFHEKWLDEQGKRIIKCDDGTTSGQLVAKKI